MKTTLEAIKSTIEFVSSKLQEAVKAHRVSKEDVEQQIALSHLEMCEKYDRPEEIQEAAYECMIEWLEMQLEPREYNVTWEAADIRMRNICGVRAGNGIDDFEDDSE